MAHVMSSQLLWPATARTESPRKEQTDSLRLLFSDVTTQWVSLSNNDPWAIWEISNYDSLLIDLEVYQATCAGLSEQIFMCMGPTPSLEWSVVCLDNLTCWLSEQQWPGRRRRICSPGDTLCADGYVDNLKGLDLSHADGLSRLTLVALLIG